MARVKISLSTYRRVVAASRAPGGFNPGFAVIDGDTVTISVSDEVAYRLAKHGPDADTVLNSALDALAEVETA